jgi:anhydro-N-acetylmuramic acid kinase
MTLNIGGIANCQLADADREKMMAFDTGPGNVMIDHAMGRFYGKDYDADGATAATGTADEAMLAELKQHPFFARPVPRSAWRLDFGADYADGFLERYAHLAPQDIVATFTEFTAWAILQSIRDNVPGFAGVTEIIASGGGVRNATLMAKLEERFAAEGIELTTSDKYGIPPQFKEAVKFATLAYANLFDLATNIPHASGAKRFATLGKLVKAPSQTKV